MPRNRPTPVRSLVADILATFPAARTSDRELIYRLFVRLGFDMPRARFMKLPSFDYVARLKREILREQARDMPRIDSGDIPKKPLIDRLVRWFGS